MKLFSSTAMQHFSASPGAIYPALKRLERAGLIRGKIENRDTLRPKQIFSLTPAGKDMLERRLTRRDTQDDIVWHLDDLMLRFAFIYDFLGPEKTKRFLNELLSETKAYILVLQKQLETIGKSISFCARSAFEYGLKTYRTLARWVKRVITQLGEEE